ncbi:MAG: hypothetical protein NUW37_05505 [Planctomycetes bacterium]|nr:hypothetical protein [Planctomycetota bacterium]
MTKFDLLSEGDDDRTILDTLKEKGLISGELEIVGINKKDNKKNDKRYYGKDGAVKQFIATAPAKTTPVKIRKAILLRDIDTDHSADAIQTWFKKVVGGVKDSDHGPVSVESCDRVSEESERLLKASVRIGDLSYPLVIVAVGKRDVFTSCEEFSNIDSFAMDDYIVGGLLCADLYTAFVERCKQRARILDVAHEVFLRKLKAMSKMLDENKIPVKKSKRLLQLSWGIFEFRASPARFCQMFLESIVEKHREERLKSLFDDLLRDIDCAVEVLRS